MRDEAKEKLLEEPGEEEKKKLCRKMTDKERAKLWGGTRDRKVRRVGWETVTY